MDRNLALELVRVTEAAAIASASFMGRGDEKAADQAAVDAMARAFEHIYFSGTVVIGEGERDETPLLYIGEKLGGAEGPPVDVAVVPLDGTTITAKGGPNALSVVAVTDAGGFLQAPDMYMDKIAVGPAAAGEIDLREPPLENLRRVASAKGVQVEDLTVIILDRPRHESLIREVRNTGARIRLIPDGDVSAAIATCEPDSGVDVLIGSGGFPEGVVAAAALRCMGGAIQGRLIARNDEEVRRAHRMGLGDLGRIFSTEDLASGDSVMFAATGVTDGAFLRGVRFSGTTAATHSVVMRSRSGTVRHIEARHRLDKKPIF